jgi:hypothetical protein
VKAYLAAVGVAMLILAAVLFVRRLSALLCAPIDEEVSYLPIVEFTDSRGHLHRFTSVAGGSSSTPAVGATVRVRYLPSNPTVAYIQSFLHMWAAPLACAVLGVGALAVLWQH